MICTCRGKATVFVLFLSFFLSPSLDHDFFLVTTFFFEMKQTYCLYIRFLVREGGLNVTMNAKVFFQRTINVGISPSKSTAKKKKKGENLAKVKM